MGATTGYDSPERAERLAEHIAGWIGAEVAQRGADGAVVAISGGIDSAVVAALSARALGVGRVHTLALPIHSAPEDEADALEVARTIGVAVRVVALGAAYEAMLSALGPSVSDHAMAAANLRPRLRMAALYAEAATRGSLVVGTGNRDELAVGYFTKYGDGGVDLLPLAHVTKGEVRALARVLGLPRRVLDRAPTAGLWAGQTDEVELGFTYADLDRYLLTGDGSADLVANVTARARMARHKLEMPPAAPPLDAPV